MAAGLKATQETRDKREAACRGCPLLSEYREGVFSCGKPRHQKLFRISSRDGCGCWLNLKWWGRDEKCPLDPPKWGAEIP